MRRRVFIIAPAAALGLAASHSANADGFPAHTIRMIVPFPAGGPTDIVARPLAAMLGDALGQTVLIDNRGGAGGSIGADAVAKAAPDGYTLLMGTVGTNAINPSLYKHLPYDPLADFTPLATIASAPVAVVVNQATPFNSIKDLIAEARAKPKSIAYGSAGNGTPGHLAGALFCTAAGIELTHVPYKGSAPALTDLLGGQIPLMFDPLQSVLSHIVDGKLRALAVTSRERARLLPKVPTLAESGLSGFETSAWWAVFAPARLPDDVKKQLADALLRIVQSPAFEGRLAPLGLQTLTRPLAEFEKSEIAKWGAAVRATGLSLD